MTIAPARGSAHGAVRLGSPFVGLVPFDEQDAPFFFGRAQEAAIVAANLRSTRLTILYGPSGVGKSSLLMAGAVHELREEARVAAGDSPFAVCVFRSAWRGDPVLGVQEAARLALAELCDPEPPGSTLAETLRAWTADAGTLLVVLDQFEEYFQYHVDEDDGEQLSGFAAELARLVNDASLPVHVLLSIREDALARLDRFEGHIPSLFSNYLRVEHLDQKAARRAIEGPIAAYNGLLPEGEAPYQIEPELVDEVVAAAAGGRLVLVADGDAAAADPARDHVEAPFLQLVLERLWRDAAERGDRSLTVARLEALGGARRIVQNHLLDALGGLTPAEQGVAADAFRFLVTRSQTKIAHPASDLADWTNRSEPEVAAVLDKLAAAESGRILRKVAPEAAGGGESYELFHDVLAEPIVAWRRAYEQERERRRVRRRFLRIGTILVAVIAVVGAIGIWALVQRHDAQKSAEATRWLGVAVAARDSVDDRLPEALLLGLAANEHSDTAEARNAMTLALEKVQQSGVSATLVGHSGDVNSVAFAPDGRTLASGGVDGTIRLWDTSTRRQLGRPLVMGQQLFDVAFAGSRTLVTAGEGHAVHIWDLRRRRLRRTLPVAGSLLNVAASPDGRFAASSADDGTLRLWDLGTLKAVAFETPADLGVSVAFSHDGDMVASGTAEGAVWVWDTATGKVIRRFPARPGDVGAGAFSPNVYAVAFSPDDRWLAGARSNGTVSMWDLGTGRRVARFAGDSGASFYSVAFGPSGRLAAGTSDGKVWLWDVRARARLGGPLQADSGPVKSVAFSRDGRTLATAGTALRLWDVAAHGRFGESLTKRGSASFYTVEFSSSGALAAAGSDGTVRLWDANGRSHGVLAAKHGREVHGVAFAPDGQTLASADHDGTIRVWSVRTGAQLAHSTGDDQPLLGLDRSPDGEVLAAGSDSGVRLWNAYTARPLGKLSKPADSDPVYGVAFSGDGKTLAAVSRSPEVWLWNVSDRRRLEPLRAPRAEFASVTFSPDGRVLAAGRGDGDVWLWDARSRKRLGVLETGQRRNTNLAFSSDGRTLATGGFDGTIRLWDVETRKPIGTVLGPSAERIEPIASVAFSPDGRTLATAGLDGSVRLWKGVLWSSRADLQATVCGLVTGVLAEREWRAEWPDLAPDLPYESPCPAWRAGA